MEGKSIMKIALHLGAHLTDGSHLRECLLRNETRLQKDGVLVGRLRDFQNLLNTALKHIVSGHGAPDIFEQLLEAVGAQDDTRRLVLSAPRLLARLPESMNETTFYPDADRRIAALRHVFKGHDVTVFLAIRNPASYVPAFLTSGRVQAEVSDDLDVQAEALRWSELITRFRQIWPEAALTVWCDEDTPFIWHRVLRLVSDHQPEPEFDTSFAWFDSVLRDGASEKLAAYLEASPPVDEAHRQRVISAFLDKFSDEEKLEIDASVTGWDEARIDLISALYEEDTDTIQEIPGVTFVAP